MKIMNQIVLISILLWQAKYNKGPRIQVQVPILARIFEEQTFPFITTYIVRVKDIRGTKCYSNSDMEICLGLERIDVLAVQKAAAGPQECIQIPGQLLWELKVNGALDQQTQEGILKRNEEIIKFQNRLIMVLEASYEAKAQVHQKYQCKRRLKVKSQTVPKTLIDPVDHITNTLYENYMAQIEEKKIFYLYTPNALVLNLHAQYGVGENQLVEMFHLKKASQVNNQRPPLS